jgi:hypothetical protein
MKVTDTMGALVDANKEAAIDSGKIIAGNIINDRLVKIITPKLPMMVRGYADTPLGKATISNAIAGVLIHTMPTNAKVMTAAECMIQSASLQLASSFNIEQMVQELLDGVPGLDVMAEEKSMMAEEGA